MSPSILSDKERRRKNFQDQKTVRRCVDARCVFRISTQQHNITDRQDLSIYRLDLLTQVGKEPTLAGLLHVYKGYFPDLILIPLPLSNQTIFKCPDQTTAAAISSLQDRWSHLAHEESHGSLINGSKDPIVRSGVGVRAVRYRT